LPDFSCHDLFSKIILIGYPVYKLFLASFWLTIFLIIGLTVTIALGFWFLHIVLSSYHYFIDRQLTIWDHQPESKHLLIEEPSIYVKTHKDSDAQNDPATEVLLSDEYVNKNCKNAL
jgi:hypothetical protein